MEKKQSPKNEKNDIRLLIEGYEVPTLENAVKQIVQKLFELKLKFSLVYLPTKEERLPAIIRSPHKHSSQKEHLGKRTHRRLVCIFNASLSDLNFSQFASNHPQLSRGINIRIKT